MAKRGPNDSSCIGLTKVRDVRLALEEFCRKMLELEKRMEACGRGDIESGNLKTGLRGLEYVRRFVADATKRFERALISLEQPAER